jgi:hypothetical protein
MEGPLEIVKKISDLVFKVRKPGSKKKPWNVNVNRMRPYFAKSANPAMIPFDFKYYDSQDKNEKHVKSSDKSVNSMISKDPTDTIGGTVSIKDQPHKGGTDLIKDQPHKGGTDTIKDQPHKGGTDTIKDQPHKGGTVLIKDQPHKGGTDSIKDQPHKGGTDTIKDQPHKGGAVASIEIAKATTPGIDRSSDTSAVDQRRTVISSQSAHPDLSITTCTSSLSGKTYEVNIPETLGEDWILNEIIDVSLYGPKREAIILYICKFEHQAQPICLEEYQVKQFRKTSKKLRTWQEIILKGKRAYEKEMKRQLQNSLTLITIRCELLPEIRVQKRQPLLAWLPKDRIDEAALSFMFIDSIGD